jgi:hypothetical protein
MKNKKPKQKVQMLPNSKLPIEKQVQAIRKVAERLLLNKIKEEGLQNPSEN